jgi:hypothetical protein
MKGERRINEIVKQRNAAGRRGEQENKKDER